MKICSISDLHGNLIYYPSDYWCELQECEILFICGDILPLNIQFDMNKSKKWLINKFIPWAEELPVEKIYFIAGNHDTWFERYDEEAHILFPTYKKVTYLKNESIEHLSLQDSNIYTIFGTPYCHIFGNWPFMRDEDTLAAYFNLIPENTDILFTHDAPYGTSDICFQGWPADGEHKGCPELKPIKDYFKVFNHLIKQTSDYICNNNLKCMVLGISGGIDSTVVAAICHEVSKRAGIPLIGRSLPTVFNKENETTTADLVGKAFCDDYKVINIHGLYNRTLYLIGQNEDSCLDLSGNTLYEITDKFPAQQTAIANGNIQARLRMIYLYNLASIHGGLVMDTDNLTENNLGYFTIHGDVGDFNPIGGLWKTEVFELAEWLLSCYSFQLPHNMYKATAEQLEKSGKVFSQGRAVRESLKLKPTAGLGITNNDLEELGAESYEQVDYILKEILAWKKSKLRQGFESFKEISLDNFLTEQQILDIPANIVAEVSKRHFASEFKRKQLPIKIQRHTFINNN